MFWQSVLNHIKIIFSLLLIHSIDSIPILIIDLVQLIFRYYTHKTLLMLFQIWKLLLLLKLLLRFINHFFIHLGGPSISIELWINIKFVYLKNFRKRFNLSWLFLHSFLFNLHLFCLLQFLLKQGLFFYAHLKAIIKINSINNFIKNYIFYI